MCIRDRLIVKLKRISVFVNGKAACSNILREERKQMDNMQVYLSGPWNPAAKATVENLYFRQLAFVKKPKLPGEVEGNAELKGSGEG